MCKEYIIASEDGMLYRSFSRIPIPFYCFGTADIDVYSTVRYSDARKFRSLRWASHCARFLSSQSNSYYCVCTAERIGSLYKQSVVDNTINDKLKRIEKETDDKIEKIITDWRKRVGFNKEE